MVSLWRAEVLRNSPHKSVVLAPTERTLPSSTTSREMATSKRDYVFIVNPNGANGKTGNNWKKLFPKLSSQLGKDWNVCEKLTTGPQHATHLAREAIQDGAAAVIAVGGDGTLHEVVNGFFEDGKLAEPKETQGSTTQRTALGLIPMGTGSDFARVFGWDNDPMKAVGRICKGETRKVDVGRVVCGVDHKERFFINVADLHLSAKAGFFSGMHKRLGNLCYVIGSLQAFQGHSNRDMKIRVDGGNWEIVPKVTAICVGNAKYFGGGMKIAPSADPSSGDLEVVIIKDNKWYDFLLNLNSLYQGTHTKLKNVTSLRVHSIDVEEMDTVVTPPKEKYLGTFVQADGEHVGFLNASFSVIPAVIDFIQ